MPPRGKAAARRNTGKKNSSAPKLTAAQLYEQAQIALQYDDVEAAADALKKAVKLAPENLEVRMQSQIQEQQLTGRDR